MFKDKKIAFLGLFIALFAYRILFGLASEFWFEDELQIYLIGLKSYTTETWPYFGPDLVYTNTQISGALQGLLVSAPLYLAKIPEAPALFLNVLSIFSLSMLAYFISQKTTAIPKYFIWILTLTTPWALHYTTRVVNPSYAMVFSIPFFVCALDLLPIYNKRIFPRAFSFFILGLSTMAIYQLHLSWVLCLPFIGLIFLSRIRKKWQHQALNLFTFCFGATISALTLIPTWLLNNTHSVNSNLVFNWTNWTNLPVIIARFLSYSGFELTYVLGASTEHRMGPFKEHWWLIPFGIFLMLIWGAQMVVFFLAFFKNKQRGSWRKLKWLIFGTTVLVWLSFFFSIKGPSSHTFVILFPLSMIYAFHCYDWALKKKAWVKKLLLPVALSCLIFQVGLGLYNFKHKSLYKDRPKVVKAIKEKDYKILGTRRADDWGYGY